MEKMNVLVTFPVKEEKRKEIQNYIEKIVKLAQMSDISEQEIIELFKLMYKGEI